MSTWIMLPGIGGSDERHWQSRWEAADPRLRRIRPSSWDRPRLCDWLEALDDAIDAASEPPLLVAHSLSCLLVAHWGTQRAKRATSIRGAVLVAVPDPDGDRFPIEARSFADVPQAPLPFPALVITSADDPYGTSEYADRCAMRWDAGFVTVGEHGHLNSDSRLEDWPLGRMLVDAFEAGTRGARGAPPVG